MKIELEVTEGLQVYPRYYNYRGGFAKLTVCKDCRKTGLYEDQHPTNPCRTCGGHIIEGYAGKWNKKENRWELHIR